VRGFVRASKLYDPTASEPVAFDWAKVEQLDDQEEGDFRLELVSP
jgi:hypothetical protein